MSRLPPRGSGWPSARRAATCLERPASPGAAEVSPSAVRVAPPRTVKAEAWAGAAGPGVGGIWEGGGGGTLAITGYSEFSPESAVYLTGFSPVVRSFCHSRHLGERSVRRCRHPIEADFRPIGPFWPAGLRAVSEEPEAPRFGAFAHRSRDQRKHLPPGCEAVRFHCPHHLAVWVFVSYGLPKRASMPAPRPSEAALQTVPT